MNSIEQGFVDPVHDAQFCFREILSALSEPGKQVKLDKHDGFTPLNASASQIVMSLCDGQVGVYLSPYLSQHNQDIKQCLNNLNFHHGVQPQDLPDADFVVIDSQQAFDFNQCNVGSEMYPEHAATVIVLTESLNKGPKLKLTGPGIKESKTVQLGVLSEDLQHYLEAPIYDYPMGLDFMFCAGQELIAISRTTKVEFMPCM